MFTKDEALSTCLAYFNGDSLAATVMVEKYLLKDARGNYMEKSPDDMFIRVSKEFLSWLSITSFTVLIFNAK